MPTRQVTVSISQIGTDSGPFTISDNVLGVLATNVPRTSLLGGYIVNSDTTATQITVTSTGVCPDSVVIDIGYVVCPTPPPPTVYEWYQVQKCSDLTYTTTTSYLENTFEVNDRVIDALNEVYIVTLVYAADPGGAQISITDTGLTGCPPAPPPGPTYYYYLGILCGGSIIEYFRSTDPALQDHANVVRAWCAICGGGSEQCFDNISPSGVVNTNDVISTHDNCIDCNNNVTSSVTSVFGYMEPCIGGTIDDFQGAAVFIDNARPTDVVFDVYVDWVFPGNTCGGGVSTNYYQVTIPAGSISSNFNACSNGAYIPSGALICSACISACDDPTIDYSAFAC